MLIHIDAPLPQRHAFGDADILVLVTCRRGPAHIDEQHLAERNTAAQTDALAADARKALLDLRFRLRAGLSESEWRTLFAPVTKK